LAIAAYMSMILITGYFEISYT